MAGHLDEIDALYDLEGHCWTPALELLAVRRVPGGARLIYSPDPDPDLLPAEGQNFATVKEALDAMWERAR